MYKINDLHTGWRARRPNVFTWTGVGCTAVALSTLILSGQASLADDPAECPVADGPGEFQCPQGCADNTPAVFAGVNETTAIPGQTVEFRTRALNAGGAAQCALSNGDFALMVFNAGDNTTNPALAQQLTGVAGGLYGEPDVPLLLPGESFPPDPAFIPVPYTIPANQTVGVIGRPVWGDVGFGLGHDPIFVHDNPPDQGGATTTRSVALLIPDISIEKFANVDKVCPSPQGTTVTYSYLVTNESPPGVDLTNIALDDDTCDNIAGPFGVAMDGMSCDGIPRAGNLAPGDTWCFECTADVVPDNGEVTNIVEVEANALGTDGVVVDDVFYTDETDLTLPAEGPTCDVVLDEGFDVAKICDDSEDFVVLCADVEGDRDVASYQWFLDGEEIEGATDECIDADQGGTYSVVVTDDHGCETECELDVEVDELECELDAGSGLGATHVWDDPCPETGEITAGVGPEGHRDIDEWIWEVVDGADDGWTINSGQGTDTLTYNVGDPNTCGTFRLTIINDHGCEATCEIDVCCGDEPGLGACTPGFWMQPHHCGHWPCSCREDCDLDENWGPYCPDGCPGGPETGTLFTDVFNDTSDGIFDGKTLDEALIPPGQMGFDPPQLRILTFHTIAALLNSAAIQGAAMQPQDVIDNWNTAIANWEATGDISHLLDAKTVVADFNEANDCPFSGHADLTQDGNVGVFDMILLMHDWGSTNSPADINKDGIVDVLDLLELVENWGEQKKFWAPSF